MKGVILAAGLGSRLAPLTTVLPKPLLAVMGEPLIYYPLEALVANAVDEVVIVTGFRGKRIRESLGSGKRWGISIEYVKNADYHLGNALSMAAVRDLVADEPFVLCMADHVIEAKLVSALFEVPPSVLRALCVDRRPLKSLDLEDATRVWVDEGSFVVDIGKGLTPWNGVDTGVFMLDALIFDAIDDLRLCTDPPYELSAALRVLLEAGERLWATDISGCFWADVDTMADLERVERILARELGLASCDLV